MSAHHMKGWSSEFLMRQSISRLEREGRGGGLVTHGGSIEHEQGGWMGEEGGGGPLDAAILPCVE